MTIFAHLDGRLSPFPTNHIEAVKLKTDRYDDDEKCPVCNMTSVKYTANKKCVHCAMSMSITFANMMYMKNNVCKNPPIWEEGGLIFATPTGYKMEIPRDIYNQFLKYGDLVQGDNTYRYTLEPCKKRGHIGVYNGKKCYLCELESANNTELSPRQQALKDKKTWYLPTDACPKCGKVSLRRVTNGQCSTCIDVIPRIAENTSPRQQAIADGQSWYMPTDACPKCGKIALRRVSDGKCKGCVREEIETPEEIMMRDCPDLVITRDDARAMGLKLYRTGKTCVNGHTTWRYVSTGNCKLCINKSK